MLGDNDGGVGDEGDVVVDEVDGVGGCGDEDDGDDEGHSGYNEGSAISMGTSTDSAVGHRASKMLQSRPSKTMLCSVHEVELGGHQGVPRLEHLGDTLGTPWGNSWGLGRLRGCLG